MEQSPFRQANSHTTALSVENETLFYVKLPPFTYNVCTRVYPKFSGLAAWSENYKWYSCLPLRAVVWLFCESV